MVNYIRLAWKLACMLRTYRTCNPTVEFSKYEFNNKLLVGVAFFRVRLCVTWTQPYISWFNVNFDYSTVRLHYLHIFFMHTKFQSDQRLIVLSSINCLNSNFCSLKLRIKDEFKDQVVNYIRLAWKLACILRMYTKCDPTVDF